MALKCSRRARGVNPRPSHIILDYLAVLGTIVRLYELAEATPAEVYTGTQLAKIFSDSSVADAILQNDIIWRESDWDGVSTPIRLTYNLRVRGRDDSVLSDGTPNTTLNFGFVARKVQLADGVTLEFSRLITTNYRIGNHNQAPGMDLLIPNTDGSVSILLISDSIIVHRACYPLSLQRQSISIFRRPSSLGGQQHGASTASPPVNCASRAANATTRPPGCYEHYGAYTDFGVPGADVDKYGKVYPNGVIVHMLRSLYACEVVMTDECVREKGITGCAFFTFSKLQPPAPSLASGSGSTPGSGSGSGSASGPETGALEVEGAPPTASQPAGGNSSSALGRAYGDSTGDGGGGGSSSLGIALGASLGGAALLSAVALVAVLARRRWCWRPSQPRGDCCTAPVGGGASGLALLPCCSDLEGHGRATTMPGESCAVDCRPKTSDPDGDGLQNSDQSPSSDPNPNSSECGEAQGLAQESNGPSILAIEPSTAATAMRLQLPFPQGTGSAYAGAAAAAAAARQQQPQVLLRLAAPAAAAGGGLLVRLPDAFFPGHRRGEQVEAEAPPDGQTAPPTAAGTRTGTGAGRRQVYGRRLQPVVEAAVAATDTVDPLVVVTPFTPHRPDLNLRLRQPLTAAANDAPEGGGGGAPGDGGPPPLAGGGDDGGGGCEVELLPNANRGRGSFGRVVEGMYRGKRVAVKLMADLAGPAVSVDSLSRSFAQEVEVLGRCQHPNVVRLLAACLTPPRLCLVMELMDTSLDSMIRRAPGCLLPMDTVLSICLDIARGLEYLHPTIMHRDLKPANVLIKDPHGPRQVAKLTDFGLSRLRSSVLLTKNPEAGTPPYMAPECFDALSTSFCHQMDMYSFGVVLWVMLSGKEPWSGLNMVRLAYLVTYAGQRLPLGAIPAGRRPPKLLRLIESCWEADPRRRPAAAEAVKAVLLVKEMISRGAVEDEPPERVASHPSTELPSQQPPQQPSPPPPPPLPPLIRQQQDAKEEEQQDQPQLQPPEPQKRYGSLTGSSTLQGGGARLLDAVAPSTSQLEASVYASGSENFSFSFSGLQA